MLIRNEGPYDYILNLSALKHVRNDILYVNATHRGEHKHHKNVQDGEGYRYLKISSVSTDKAVILSI